MFSFASITFLIILSFRPSIFTILGAYLHAYMMNFTYVYDGVLRIYPLYVYMILLTGS
jgi:hypothetical protein